AAEEHFVGVIAAGVGALRGENASDERRHHLLQPLFGIAVRFDETHAAVRDDRGRIIRWTDDARARHFTQKLDVGAFPSKRKPEARSRFGLAVMFDESASDTDVEQQRALSVDLRENRLGELQPLKSSSIVGNHVWRILWRPAT